MPKWILELPVDRGLYRVDLRTKTYRYIGPNPRSLTAEENALNKRQPGAEKPWQQVADQGFVGGVPNPPLQV